MRTYYILYLLFILLFSCQEKQEHSAGQMAGAENKIRTVEAQHQVPTVQLTDFSKTYSGTIDGKLQVVFQLEHKQGKLQGFYFYRNQGIDIQLDGMSENGKLVLSERDQQQNKRADMELTVQGNQLSGTWEKPGSGKKLRLELTETNQRIPALPENIVGIYRSSAPTECKLELKITQGQQGFFYVLTTPERILKGKITFVRSLEEATNYILLGGITWAENEGDVSNAEDEDNAAELELPVGIEGFFNPGEITIQNYGNAMNYYVKLADCGDKYIYLRK